MAHLTPDEIDQYRSELADRPEALRALDMIEDCEGDLEDAAIALALHVGQEPDRSDDWLNGLAKRWRVSLCQSEFKHLITEKAIATAIQQLKEQTDLPETLATAVIFHVLKTGIDDFCKPLGELL
jgi:hypothetical protein